jgi:hypothetical protein
VLAFVHRGTSRRIALRAGSLALAGLALWVAPASATFHEISIREVYPGSAAQPELEYVELQMWTGGQNFVKGHTLTSYEAGGAVADTSTFTVDVPGGANQSTILLATPAAESELGVKPDAAMAPGRLDPAGGAVCWEALDCVSWGSFGASLPSPAGSPATPAGIPDGMALRRTIAPGCASLLEPTDDRDNSAADFSPAFPGPRANSIAPSERPCASPGGPSGGSGGQGGHDAPQTTLKRKPPRRIRDRTPTFRFAADEPGSSFQCKLDRRRFRSCRSPFTTARLSIGSHIFRVRARDGSGNPDPTPASFTFRVIARR